MGFVEFIKSMYYALGRSIAYADGAGPHYSREFYKEVLSNPHLLHELSFSIDEARCNLKKKFTISDKNSKRTIEIRTLDQLCIDDPKHL